MALKNIIDHATVIERMALKNISEVQLAVDSVLTSAHVLLQGILNTVFEPTLTARTDLFFPQTSVYAVLINNLITLRLSQAFVWPESVEVYSADARKEATEATEQISTDDYLVEPSRGYILLEPEYMDHWIKVKYKAGFNTDHPAPDWLQEAVLAYMPMLLAQPTGGIDVQTMRAILEIHKSVEQQVGKMVEPYLRNRALQILPITW